MSLYDKLEALSHSDMLPMHMPGHKRKSYFAGDLPYSLDITEIDGFDNLHSMNGVLKELSERMARLWNVPYVFPVVTGSTAGILASIYACTVPGDTVIMFRTCHKSVYHAVEAFGLHSVYINDVSDTENALEQNPQAKVAIITSPTYEGIVSDVALYSRTVHKYGAKLIVDCAHGAHFGLSEYFPQNPVAYGADIAVCSLHKTLPTMTGCAMLCHGENIDHALVGHALSIFETSSPSYVLLASIERCVETLEMQGRELFDKYVSALDNFYQNVSDLQHLKILRAKDSDIGKIVISCQNCNVSGPELAELLRSRYHIEVEMSACTYVLAMTSIADTQEDLDRLANVLRAIDRDLEFQLTSCAFNYEHIPQSVMTLSEARKNCGVYLPFDDNLQNKVCLEYLWAYPPGVPIIAPGEVIDSEVIEIIHTAMSMGVEIHSTYSKFPSQIFVKV